MWEKGVPKREDPEVGYVPTSFPLPHTGQHDDEEDYNLQPTLNAEEEKGHFVEKDGMKTKKREEEEEGGGEKRSRE